MKATIIAAVIVLLSIVRPFPAMADDLRCSAGWDFDGNGFLGTLNVTVAADGSLTGTVYGDPIQGFYNNVANEIMFIRSPNGSGDPADQQVYTGYYWPEGGFDNITGFFEAFANAGASAGRHRYGFKASCQIIGSPVAGAATKGADSNETLAWWSPRRRNALEPSTLGMARTQVRDPIGTLVRGIADVLVRPSSVRIQTLTILPSLPSRPSAGSNSIKSVTD